MITKSVTRSAFFDTAEGEEIKLELQQMSKSSKYNTASSYSANSLRYPDNLMPFMDKHINYLVSHPALDPIKYLANIKLMTRVR